MFIYIYIFTDYKSFIHTVTIKPTQNAAFLYFHFLINKLWYSQYKNLAQSHMSSKLLTELKIRPSDAKSSVSPKYIKVLYEAKRWCAFRGQEPHLH